MPFYKRDDDSLHSASSEVYGPGYTLEESLKDTYTYPVEGWYWFDTLDLAIAFFARASLNTTPAEAGTYEAAVTELLDNAAIAAGYDNINTVISYAEEPAVPKFQADGKRFRTWRSLVWAYAYEQLALVNSGGRTQPTVAEFLAELPVLAVSA